MSIATARKQRPQSKKLAPADAEHASGPVASGVRRARGSLAGGPAVRLPVAVQPKLTVGTPGDRYEKEADHVAERVTSGHSAGEISRIPPGGLKAQRQTEEGSEENAQTLEVQRQPEGSAEQEQPPGAQAASESGERQAQAQSEPPDEGPAQAKCAACDGEEEAQRQEQESSQESAQMQAEPQGEQEPAQKQDEPEAQGESAQAKCAGCDGEDAAQRAPAEEESAQREASSEEQSAQARGGAEDTVQRQEDGGEEEAETEAEDEGEEREAGGGDEDANAPECGPAEGGGAESEGSEETAGEEGEGGEEAAEGEAGGEAEGGGREAAAREVGCGEEGGEEEPEAPAATGGTSCGATTEAGAEGEGSAEGAGEEAAPPAPSPAGAAAAGGSVPACAAEVEAEREEPEAAEPEGGGAEPAAAGGEGECRAQGKEDESAGAAQTQEEEQNTAQTKEEAADTQRQEEDGSAQTATDDEQAAAQTQEEESAQAGEDPRAQMREEEQAQARSSSARVRRLQPHVAARHMHARGAGEPLLPSVRERVEATLGVDLEGVRVHADSNAQAASKALRAKAFTHRNHIFLGVGQSQHDVGLMAHESTHVLQQDGVVRRKPKSEPLRDEDTATPAPPPGPATATPHAAAPAAAGAGSATATGVAAPARASRAPAAAAAVPEVAHLPAPAGPVPVPYPSVGPAAPAGAKKVEASSRTPRPARSELPASKGEEAGAGAGVKGVVSSKTATGAMKMPLPVAPESVLPGAPAITRALAPPTAPGAPATAPPPTAAAAPSAPAAERAAPAPAEPAAARPSTPEPAVAPTAPRPAAPSAAKTAAARAPAAKERPAAAPGATHPARAPRAAGIELRHPRAARAGPGTKPAAMHRTVAAAGTGAGLQGVLVRLAATAAAARSHAAPDTKVEEAHNAARIPADAPASQAEEAQVAAMESAAAQPKDFLAMLEEALARAELPENPEQLEAFKKGAWEGVRTMIGSAIARGQASATASLRETTSTRPGESAAAPPAPAPMPSEPVLPVTQPVGAREAVPAPKDELEISGDPYKQEAEALLAESQLDEKVLREADDPLAAEVVQTKAALEKSADAMPDRYRAAERVLLGTAEAHLSGSEARGLDAMAAARTSAQAGVQAIQDGARARREAEEQRATDTLRAMCRATRESVERQLESLDSRVVMYFEAGEASAREQFEDTVAPLAFLQQWVGLDEEDVAHKYAQARREYRERMHALFVFISGFVEARLRAAHETIEDGRRRIAQFKQSLSEELVRATAEVRRAITEEFGELEGAVEDKRESLAEDLAQRAVEGRQALDQRLEEIREENRGLLDRLVTGVKRLVAAIEEFIDRIGALIQQGGEVVAQIRRDPVSFGKNVGKGLSKGFERFWDHIDIHLQRGLLSWLFGTVRAVGVAVPTGSEDQSFLSIVLEVLGITVDRIKARLARLIGQRNMERIEAGLRIAGEFLREGPAGLWNLAKERFAELKTKLWDAIEGFLKSQIIDHAIRWILGLLIPFAGLFKLFKFVYTVFAFFVENLERILDVVQTVFRSLGKIASGAIDDAAKWIEDALGRTVPVVIAFLARLLNIPSLIDRVRRVVRDLRRLVDRAIDAALRRIVAAAKKIAGKVRAAGRRGVTAVKRFLFPQRAFRAGSENHRLYFSGIGPQATLMIASDTQALEGFVAQLRARPENQQGPNKTALDTVTAQIAVINGQRIQIEAKPDQARTGIDTALAVIADQLGKVLASEDFATESNPLPLAYPKRASERYPAILAGPQVGSGGPRISQALLQEAEADPAKKQALAKQLSPRARKNWEDRGLAIERFEPHGRKSLPEGGETIGLEPQWQTSVGKKLKIPPPRSTPGGGRINEALSPYGFSPKGEGLDGDHVVEIQLGGEDVIPNLWPLDKSENRGAGATLKSARFDKPGGGTITMVELKQRAEKEESVWLVITSTR